jgi:hypothetical protein
MLENSIAPAADPVARTRISTAAMAWLPLWFALAILLVFHLRFVPTHLVHYTDPVIYLAGAESIAEGQGYRFITHAGMPRIGCQPPLNSAYLALFWKLNPQFPENVGLLYGGLFLLVGATFALFYRYCLKNGVPPVAAAALILAWGLSAQWGTLLWGFMSDILFGALILALANYWWEVKDVLSPRRWLVTGSLVALMYLTRTAATAFVGVLALVVLILSWKCRTAKPALAFLTPILPAIGLWKWWAAGTPGYGDYIRFRITEEGSLAAVFKYNFDSALDYLSGLGFVRCFFGSMLDLPSHPAIFRTTLSPMLTAFMMIFCWVFTVCWVVGFWRTRSKQQLIVGCLVGAYLLQLCIYPANLSERALYAVLPLILIWAWKGFALALERWPRMQLLRPVTLVLASFCIVANAVAFGRSADYLNGSGRCEELVEIGQWLRTNSPPETLVAATISEPTMHFYKFADRRVVENYFQKQPTFSVAGHSTNGDVRATYVLLDWYSSLKSDELNGGLKLEKASARGGYRLYRVTQP